MNVLFMFPEFVNIVTIETSHAMKNCSEFLTASPILQSCDSDENRMKRIEMFAE